MRDNSDREKHEDKNLAGLGFQIAGIVGPVGVADSHYRNNLK